MAFREKDPDYSLLMFCSRIFHSYGDIKPVECYTLTPMLTGFSSGRAIPLVTATRTFRHALFPVVSPAKLMSIYVNKTEGTLKILFK